MASAWGVSWGVSWGTSWGATVPAPTIEPSLPSGSGGGYNLRPYEADARRKKKARVQVGTAHGYGRAYPVTVSTGTAVPVGTAAAFVRAGQPEVKAGATLTVRTAKMQARVSPAHARGAARVAVGTATLVELWVRELVDQRVMDQALIFRDYSKLTESPHVRPSLHR